MPLNTSMRQVISPRPEITLGWSNSPRVSTSLLPPIRDENLFRLSEAVKTGV